MDEFEEQIRLQRQAAAGKLKASEEKRTRTDPDGTVFEFDPEKKAWFPRIDADFIANYQMSYGESQEAKSSSNSEIPPQPQDVNSPEYRDWYYKYYSNTSQQATASTANTANQNYDEYYKQYYQNYYQHPVDTSKMTEEEKEQYQAGKQKYEEYYDTSKMSEDEKKKYDEERAEHYKKYYQSSNASNTSAEDQSKAWQEYYASQDTSKMTEEEKKKFNEEKAKSEENWKKYLENPRTAGMSEKERQEYESYWQKHAQAPETTKLMEKDKQAQDDYMKAYKEFFYGGEEDDEEEEKSKKGDYNKDNGKKEKKKKDPQPKKTAEWFDVGEEKNTNVYVTGLPDDITQEEFEDEMKKFGLIMYDPFTRKPKVKLYKDASGAVKGDGLCCYIKQESVDLCMKILDGSTLRGFKIFVERAKFEKKGSFDPDKAKKKKLSNKQKKKMKERQEKLFGWKVDEDDAGRKKHERIIVVKNVFDPATFEQNPAAINAVRDKLRNECSNFGEVKKVIIYDRHADGVATVAFPEPEIADTVINSINNRVFYGRTITACTWDGKTKYDIKETAEEEQKRLTEWTKFLETGDDESKAKRPKLDVGESSETGKTGDSEVDNKETDQTGNEDKKDMEHKPSGDEINTDENTKT